MFVRTKKTPNSPRQSVQIVESTRKGNKVAQVIVQHVGIADDDEQLLALKRLAKEMIHKLKADRKADKERERGFQKELFSDEMKEIDSLAFDAGSERLLEETDHVGLATLEHDARVLDGPFEVVEWAFQNMGLNAIFWKTARDAAKVKLLKQCLAGMLTAPLSKRGISTWLANF